MLTTDDARDTGRTAPPVPITPRNGRTASAAVHEHLRRLMREYREGRAVTLPSCTARDLIVTLGRALQALQ